MRMSIWGIFLGFDWSFFWYHYQKQWHKHRHRHQNLNIYGLSHQSRELHGDILPWLQFKVVQFIWKCIGTLSLCYCTAQNCRQLPIAACANLAPNIQPLKPNLTLTDQNVELSKYSDESLTSFSVFEIKKSPW